VRSKDEYLVIVMALPAAVYYDHVEQVLSRPCVKKSSARQPDRRSTSSATGATFHLISNQAEPDLPAASPIAGIAPRRQTPELKVWPDAASFMKYAQS